MAIAGHRTAVATMVPSAQGLRDAIQREKTRSSAPPAGAALNGSSTGKSVFAAVSMPGMAC